MAQIRTIDSLRHRIMRNFSNVSMTVTAFDAPVNTLIVKCFIYIIIPSFAIFIDSADKAVFVAHEAIFFVGGF